MAQVFVHIPDRNARVTRGVLQPTIRRVLMAEKAMAVDGQLMPVPVEGELRILDIDLAKRLGFERPRKIRDMIKRYETDLLRMGTCPTVGRVINGGEALQFYLNRKQAIFITAKSETEMATDITIEIIERFDAYERGEAPAAKPLTREQIMAQALLLADQTMKEQAEQIAALAPKAEALDRIATADGALCVTEAAKVLQVRPKDLFGFLSTNGWIYRRHGSGTWLGYQTRTNAGDLAHTVSTVLQADGTERIFEQVKVTPQGLTKLAKLMPGRLVQVPDAAA